MYYERRAIINLYEYYYEYGTHHYILLKDKIY